MIIRQHERLVEELDVQLTLREPLTSSAAVMTLPAATTDLQGWITDRRKFLSVQYDDWMQVVADFRESADETGPKLRAVVEPTTAQIGSLLPRLIQPVPPAVPGECSYTIDSVVRAQIHNLLDHLQGELSSEPAMIAAWRDLVKSAEMLNRSIEEVSFRRDTLWAIAEHRNVDVGGSFGLFASLRAVVTDVADAVEEELARAAGRPHTRTRPPSWDPSGQPPWRRLQLCEQLLAQKPFRGDCIVWLRLARTSLPQEEVTHGQVTFYNATILNALAGHPECADRFQLAPMEILTPPRPEDAPILRDGEVEFENDWNMAYARVLLPGVEVHKAEAKARALVEGLIAVNHATKDTWRLLRGHLLFIDSRRHTRWGWGPKEAIADTFYPQNDWMGRDIASMARNNRLLNDQSIQDLQAAIGMSTTLKIASDESPQATVMAAVRAIEHVNVWTTGGVANWADFVSDYFKKAQSRVRIVELISHYTRYAVNDCVPDRRPGAPAQHELFEIRSRLNRHTGGHEVYNVRGAADEVAALRRIYADHWLSRGLGEIDNVLATPAGMHARLEEQGRRFDRLLRRLKRLRNSAIHGGPLSETACASVDVFANNLGHQCLNEAMRALLSGTEIPIHMTEYRTNHIDRYERARTAGDIDALFVKPAWAVNDDGDLDDVVD